MSSNVKEILNDMSNCKNCSLSKIRRQVVPGIGSVKAKVMLIGDYPGIQENIKGKPFVGESGLFMRKVLHLLEVKPEEIFITNAIKCFPGNEKILAAHIKACKEHTDKLIYEIDPILIICLGEISAKQILNSSLSTRENMGAIYIAKIQGKLIEYQKPVGILVNPAYLLRNYGEALKKNIVPTEIQIFIAALQHYFMLVDRYYNLQTGEPIPTRGKNVLQNVIRYKEDTKCTLEDRWEEFLAKMEKQ
jgi:DNA polymerase